jgi:Protein of unknown function (DUF2905)
MGLEYETFLWMSSTLCCKERASRNLFCDTLYSKHTVQSYMIGFGKLLIVLGGMLVVAGLILLLLGRTNLPIGRLPGDIIYRGKHTTFYFPLATSILLSVVLSLIFYLIGRWHR